MDRQREGSHVRHRSNSRGRDWSLRRQTLSHEDGLDESHYASFDPYPSTGLRKPLVDFCTNEWKTNPIYYSRAAYADDEDDSPFKFLNSCLGVLRSPKVRRYFLIYTILWLVALVAWKTFIAQTYHEHSILMRSLTATSRDASGGWFGTNMRASFPGLTQIRDLDPRFFPQDKVPQNPKDRRRLVFVGDVHGCRDELLALLNAVSFNPETDHLILTGDIIGKGPDSRGAVNIARKLSASCVRGNHEDRVLLVQRELSSTLLPIAGSPKENDNTTFDWMDERSYSRGDERDRHLARSLSSAQLSYLESCPVIFRIGGLLNSLGDILVVHAGLVAGVALDSQDPSAVMSMRTVDLETHMPSKKRDGGESAVPWFKLWNKHQSLLGTKHFIQQPEPQPHYQSEPMLMINANAHQATLRHSTVIYGHDSGRGLQLAPYTKGLDTGCYSGGRLTALVVSDGGAQKIHQVKCRDYRYYQTEEPPTFEEVDELFREEQNNGEEEDEEDKLIKHD